MKREIEKNIRARSLRELVLLRPGMYFYPRWDAEGLHLLVLEIIRMAVDPERLNACSSILVIVEPSGELVISDNGRGLPITPIRFGSGVERPAIEHVMTFAVTRHPDCQYYEEYGFLDYLAAVLNALSSRLLVETTFDNERYTLACARGEIVEHLKKLEPSNERGTRMKILPDSEVFREITFDSARILQGLRLLAAKHPQVRFIFDDQCSGNRTELYTSTQFQ